VPFNHPAFRILDSDSEIREAAARAAATERASAQRLEDRAARYDDLVDDKDLPRKAPRVPLRGEA
jgi:hypothetical protein